MIPDYGMWERGDKSNQNIVELNSSSVGMAKAALAAIKGLNLFGGKGGAASVIHVIPDEISKGTAVLETMLPRGSHSKETDAGILTIIGYPGFAIKKEKLAEETLQFLLEKLSGKYGMKRFLKAFIFHGNLFSVNIKERRLHKGKLYTLSVLFYIGK